MSELLNSLVRTVRFEGVTGPVDFFEADSSRLFNGDRRVGAKLALMNYKSDGEPGSTGDSAFARVGLWTACRCAEAATAWTDCAPSTSTCAFEERWNFTAVPFSGFSFSSSDNSLPLETVPSRISVVRIGVLLPMFSTRLLEYRRFKRAQFAAVYLALREINNKTDGIEDGLLPTTTIEFAYRDSKCDLLNGMLGAQSLITETFSALDDGDGVDAIIGTGCRQATIPAAQLAAQSRVLMLSPVVNIEPSEVDVDYGYFVRMVPAPTLLASTMVGVLRDLFGYTDVAMVQDRENEEAEPFVEEAARRQLTIVRRVQFRGELSADVDSALLEDAELATWFNATRDDEFGEQYTELSGTGARVIVLFCTAQVTHVTSM